MDLEDFIQFIEWEEEIGELQRIPKRYIRDQQNPFEFYEDVEFRRRYRFSKLVVRDEILPLVTDSLQKNSNRGLPILPIVQLLVTLRFYATGNYQEVAGDLRGISQASVSIILKRVSIALAEHLGNIVKFPNHLIEQQNNVRKFFQIANFPNIAACVDGTHILIKNPGGDIGEIFRNRKGQFSINVQVACGPNMEILNIVARHPGSTHDNVIFEQSGLRVKFENNEVQGILLGDNGYACKRYLLTPVINAVTLSEQNYNRAHIRTRNIVERVFGVWKRRFPCLKRTLQTKVETSVAIICATAVLHNIGRNLQDIIEGHEPNEGDDWADNIIIIQDRPGDGLAFRRTFILTHF